VCGTVDDITVDCCVAAKAVVPKETKEMWYLIVFALSLCEMVIWEQFTPYWQLLLYYYLVLLL
jgi:hypothetical protein